MITVSEPLVDATSMIHKLFEGKTDNSGAPYVEHCLRVSRRLNPAMRTELKIIALLHDVIEDTPTTRTQLESIFGTYIAYGVSVLSNLHKDPYEDFIERVIACEDWEITLVKLCDLYDNTSPYRLSLLPKETRERFERKYSEPIQKVEKSLGVRSRFATKGDIYLPV